MLTLETGKLVEFQRFGNFVDTFREKDRGDAGRICTVADQRHRVGRAGSIRNNWEWMGPIRHPTHRTVEGSLNCLCIVGDAISFGAKILNIDDSVCTA